MYVVFSVYNVNFVCWSYRINETENRPFSGKGENLIKYIYIWLEYMFNQYFKKKKKSKLVNL